MWLTKDNAKEFLGKCLDLSRRLYHYYPVTVIQFPDGTYATKNSVGICSPIGDDRFNQTWFDIVDGKHISEGEE